ncbi:MAG TPA: hypothetical protein VI877_05785 [Dehalococcoidia bacterium]|nr:hypothetical protein [Dehalococcoidia bacterium]
MVGVKAEQKKGRHGHLKLKTRFIIRKFADDEAHRRDQPYKVSRVEGNIGLNEGIAEWMDLAMGAGGTAYNNANSQTGVGDSTTAEAATQTDLQAAVNKTYKGMDATYPSRSAQTVSFRSTYGSADANYAWAEFIVRNGATALKDIIRKVSAQGTKTSGQTWELTIQITMS